MANNISTCVLLTLLSVGQCFAGDSESLCKLYCDKILSKDVDVRGDGWNGIRFAIDYCPADPRLKETLIQVLTDETRCDEWSGAFIDLRFCLECDPRIDDANASILLDRLARYQRVTRNQAIRCFGALKLHSKGTVTALEPLLNEQFGIRDLAASSILRVNAHHEQSMNCLLRDLDSDDWQIRHYAAYFLSLTRTDSKDAVTKIRSRLQDEHPSVRICAAWAMWACTHSEADVLPVVVSCLNEDRSPIVLRPYFSPSDRLVPHHGLAIAILGEMAVKSKVASALLERLVRREIPFRGDWKANRSSLLAAWGKSRYGASTDLEGTLAIAEHEDDPLRQLALEEIGPENLVETKLQVTLWKSSCTYKCKQ